MGKHVATFMSNKQNVQELSVEELEQLLYRKKRTLRHARLQRLKEQGRLVEVAGLEPPNPVPPPLSQPIVTPQGALRDLMLADNEGALDDEALIGEAPESSIQWRWIANKLLLTVEILAVVGFLGMLVSLWSTRQELNAEIAGAQELQAEAVALPTAEPTPIIGVAVLPSGHKPPVEGQPPQPGEAGYIPDHLQTVIANYRPPPVPTPGPEQARRIQIPALNVDKPIVQGDDWEQLKKGVGQHVGSATPGQDGNLVLSAHNDIYGEIFRDLDKLSPGDEIIISTERSVYTYVVREWRVVEPTAVEVMDPTTHASSTLISCYPYLVNDKRIVVFADLVTTSLEG